MIEKLKIPAPEYRAQPHSACAGFSLVEMIAALLIFSVGVLAVMQVFAGRLRATSASLGYTRAVSLAQQVMEETIAERDTTFMTVMSESGDFGTEFPNHSWSCEFEDMDQSGLQTLHVTITWEDRGREKKYVLATLIAERQ